MGPATDNESGDKVLYTARVKYTDAMADHYLKKSEGRRGRENAALLDILRRFEVKGALLDAPCGVGRVGALLSGQGVRYCGADFSMSMLRRARARLSGCDLKYDLLRCDLERVPLVDRAFDTTLSLRFLHHLPDGTRGAVLKELARITDRILVVTFFHPLALHYVERRVLSFLKRITTGRGSNRYSHTTTWLVRVLAAEGWRLKYSCGTGFLRETRYAVFERI